MKAKEVIGHEMKECKKRLTPQKLGHFNLLQRLRVARDDGPFSYYK